MISHSVVEVRKLAAPGGAPTGEAPVILAPFGAAEMAAVMPIDPLAAPYERGTTVSALINQDPADIADRLGSIPHTTTFGIYDGEVSTAAFAGIVELAKMSNPERTNGGPDYTTALQAVGVHIYRQRQQGRGLGSSAVQAAMRYAIKVEDTQILHAQTSERNGPMQNILHKLGYYQGPGSLPIRHYNGSGTRLQLWYFATSSALDMNMLDEATRKELAEGYSRFSRFALRHKVSLLPRSS